MHTLGYPASLVPRFLFFSEKELDIDLNLFGKIKKKKKKTYARLVIIQYCVEILND